MADTIYYPDYNKPELILSFDTIRLENLPRSRPGRNNQSRVETPGGAAIVQSLGPRVQYLQWNIRNMDNTDKTTLYNFFNDTVEWSLYTFDYLDSQGNLFHGCRYWQDEDDFQQANYTNRFTENITIRVNAVQHIYAGAASTGIVYRSTDGVTWSQVSDTTESNINSFSLFKNTLYMGTDPNANILKSIDGVTFSTSYDESAETDINCLFVFNGYLYAGTGNNDGRIIRTDDGVTWTDVFDDSTETSINALCVFNNYIYAGTSASNILRSSDGTTWELVNTESSEQTITALATFGSYIYATSGSIFGNKDIYRSSNGTDWSIAYDGDALFWLLYATKNYIYATNIDNEILRSSDGTSWSVIYTDATNDILSIASFNSYLYALTSDGRILRSSDNGDTFSQSADLAVSSIRLSVFTF